MLTEEQQQFLSWLLAQGEPVSIRFMDPASTPGFTLERLEELRKNGLIHRDIASDPADGSLVGVYTISDTGRAALDEIDRADQAKRTGQLRFVVTTLVAIAGVAAAIWAASR